MTTETQAPDPAHELMARLIKAQEQRDELRQALEVIALGDAADPVRDAGDTLVELGWWSGEALAASRAAIPAPEGAQLPPLPPHPDARVFTWTSRELAAIKRYGEECARAALAGRPGYPTGQKAAEPGPGIVRCPRCWELVTAPQAPVALTPEQLDAVATQAVKNGMPWLGFKTDENGEYRIPVLSVGDYVLVKYAITEFCRVNGIPAPKEPKA